MNSSFNPYAVASVSEAPLETRTEFVRKTYTHLAGAIGVFAVLEWVLLQIIPPQAIFSLLQSSPYTWLVVVTGFMVLGLTAIAFTTKKDFSFLGGMLKIGFLIALGVIVASIFMPGLASGMGLWFSLVMILLASGSILYNTSQIMFHYAPGQHVAASLSLFASVALLFYYVLRLFMNRD